MDGLFGNYYAIRLLYRFDNLPISKVEWFWGHDLADTLPFPALPQPSELLDINERATMVRLFLLVLRLPLQAGR